MTASVAVMLFDFCQLRMGKVVQPRDVPWATDVRVRRVSRRMIGEHVKLVVMLEDVVLDGKHVMFVVVVIVL